MIKIIREDGDAIYEHAELYSGLDKRIDNLILDNIKSLCDKLELDHTVFDYVNMGLSRINKNDSHGYIVKLSDINSIRRFMEAWNESN